jgi:hypothetical protein
VNRHQVDDPRCTAIDLPQGAQLPPARKTACAGGQVAFSSPAAREHPPTPAPSWCWVRGSGRRPASPCRPRRATPWPPGWR